MDALSEYYTVHVVATLNLNKMNADVAHKFAELCGSLNTTTSYRHQIKTTTSGPQIVRESTFVEMFDMLCQNEYTRMWSANDKEKKELQALAEEGVKPEDTNTE
jgi:hypothetical protein